MDDILVFRTGVLGTWREKFAGVAATGRTIGAEILERRLATACDLLKAGRNSVEARKPGLCAAWQVKCERHRLPFAIPSAS